MEGEQTQGGIPQGQPENTPGAGPSSGTDAQGPFGTGQPQGGQTGYGTDAQNGQTSYGTGTQGGQTSYGTGAQGGQTSYGSTGVQTGQTSSGTGTQSGQTSFGTGAQSSQTSYGTGTQGSQASYGTGAQGGQTSYGTGTQGGQTSYGTGTQSGQASYGTGTQGSQTSYGAGQQSGQGWNQASSGGQTYTAPPAQEESKVLAVVSLVTGIISLVLFCTCLNIIFAIVSIICGAVYLTKRPKEGKGLAIGGMICSGVSILLLVVFWTFAIVMGISRSGAVREELWDYAQRLEKDPNGSYDEWMDEWMDEWQEGDFPFDRLDTRGYQHD